MTGMHGLSLSQEATLQRALQPGERVRWAGQPAPTRAVLGSLLLWLFFIPWTAFAVFWMVAASGFEVPTFTQPNHWFALFGLPFVLIGLGGLSSPFWVWRKVRRTIHVISDRRAFTLVGGRTMSVESWAPSQLDSITRTEQADGSGDLLFATAGPLTAQGKGAMRGFRGIANVRDAEQALRRLIEYG